MRNKGKKLLVFVIPFVSISRHGQLTDVICLCAWLPGVCLVGGKSVYCVGRKGESRVEPSGAVLSVSDVPTRHHHPAPPSTAQPRYISWRQECGVGGLPSLPVDSEPEHTQTTRFCFQWIIIGLNNNWNHQTSRYLLLKSKYVPSFLYQLFFPH